MASDARSCCLCGLQEDDIFQFGKLFELEDKSVVHHYCLLFSVRLAQSGRDDEGAEGFLLKDIRKEIVRSKSVRCFFCDGGGATSVCMQVKCKKQYHVGCLTLGGGLLQFFGQFRSYCCEHRPRQKVTPAELTEPCGICMEESTSDRTSRVLRTPCCKHVYHATCLQKMAYHFGYFFSCPGCRNKDNIHGFLKEMRIFGIFVPKRDASWEMAPGAYQELLERHSRCDAEYCLCVRGRDFQSRQNDSVWRLLMCATCGSVGSHVGCDLPQPVRADGWDCELCRQAGSGPGVRHKRPSTKLSLRAFVERNATTLGQGSSSSDALPWLTRTLTLNELLRRLQRPHQLIKFTVNQLTGLSIRTRYINNGEILARVAPGRRVKFSHDQLLPEVVVTLHEQSTAEQHPCPVTTADGDVVGLSHYSTLERRTRNVDDCDDVDSVASDDRSFTGSPSPALSVTPPDSPSEQLPGLSPLSDSPSGFLQDNPSLDQPDADPLAVEQDPFAPDPTGFCEDPFGSTALDPQRVVYLESDSAPSPQLSDALDADCLGEVCIKTEYISSLNELAIVDAHSINSEHFRASDAPGGSVDTSAVEQTRPLVPASTARSTTPGSTHSSVPHSARVSFQSLPGCDDYHGPARTSDTSSWSARTMSGHAKKDGAAPSVSGAAMPSSSGATVPSSSISGAAVPSSSGATVPSSSISGAAVLSSSVSCVAVSGMDGTTRVVQVDEVLRKVRRAVENFPCPICQHPSLTLTQATLHYFRHDVPDPPLFRCRICQQTFAHYDGSHVRSKHPDCRDGEQHMESNFESGKRRLVWRMCLARGLNIDEDRLTPLMDSIASHFRMRRPVSVVRPLLSVSASPQPVLVAPPVSAPPTAPPGAVDEGTRRQKLLALKAARFSKQSGVKVESPAGRLDDQGAGSSTVKISEDLENTSDVSNRAVDDEVELRRDESMVSAAADDDEVDDDSLESGGHIKTKSVSTGGRNTGLTEKERKDFIAASRSGKSKRYKCPHCSYTSLQSHTMGYHFRFHSEEKRFQRKNFLYKCSECYFANNVRRSFAQHQQLVHGKSTIKSLRKPQLSAVKDNRKRVISHSVGTKLALSARIRSSVAAAKKKCGSRYHFRGQPAESVHVDGQPSSIDVRGSAEDCDETLASVSDGETVGTPLGGRWECPFCDCFYRDADGLGSHLRSWHWRPEVGSSCDSIRCFAGAVDYHRQLYHKSEAPEWHRCRRPECGGAVMTRPALPHVCLPADRTRPLAVCSIGNCAVRCGDQRELDAHLIVCHSLSVRGAHGNRGRPYWCPFCLKKYAYRGLIIHFDSKHPSMVNQTRDSGPESAFEAVTERQEQDDALLRDIFGVSSEQARYDCPFCDTFMYGSCAYQTHMRQYHRLTDRTDGALCPAAFCCASQTSMYHVSMCHKAMTERYACDQCDWTAPHRASLQHHRRRHVLATGQHGGCPFCPWLSNTGKANGRHILVSHTVRVRGLPGDPAVSYPCPECSVGRPLAFLQLCAHLSGEHGWRLKQEGVQALHPGTVELLAFTEPSTEGLAEQRDKSDQAEQRAKPYQAEQRAKPDQAEQRAKPDQAEQRAKSSQAEQRAKSGQAEQRDKSSQAEQRAKSGQAEQRAKSSQTKQRAKSGQTKQRAKSNQAEQRDKSDQAEQRDKSGQAEQRAKSGQAEQRAKSGQAKQRAKSGQAEQRAKSGQAEQRTKSGQAEQRAKSGQAEQRAKSGQAEQRAKSGQAEQRAAKSSQVTQRVKSNKLVQLVTKSKTADATKVERSITEAASAASSLISTLTGDRSLKETKHDSTDSTLKHLSKCMFCNFSSAHLLKTYKHERTIHIEALGELEERAWRCYSVAEDCYKCSVCGKTLIRKRLFFQHILKHVDLGEGFEKASVSLDMPAVEEEHVGAAEYRTECLEPADETTSDVPDNQTTGRRVPTGESSVDSKKGISSMILVTNKSMADRGGDKTESKGGGDDKSVPCVPISKSNVGKPKASSVRCLYCPSSYTPSELGGHENVQHGSALKWFNNIAAKNKGAAGYSCYICSRKFRFKRPFLRHLINIHQPTVGDAPSGSSSVQPQSCFYKCRFCTTVFSNGRGRRQHEKRVHRMAHQNLHTFAEKYKVGDYIVCPHCKDVKLKWPMVFWLHLCAKHGYQLDSLSPAEAKRNEAATADDQCDRSSNVSSDICSPKEMAPTSGRSHAAAGVHLEDTAGGGAIRKVSTNPSKPNISAKRKNPFIIPSNLAKRKMFVKPQYLGKSGDSCRHNHPPEVDVIGQQTGFGKRVETVKRKRDVESPVSSSGSNNTGHRSKPQSNASASVPTKRRRLAGSSSTGDSGGEEQLPTGCGARRSAVRAAGASSTGDSGGEEQLPTGCGARRSAVPAAVASVADGGPSTAAVSSRSTAADSDGVTEMCSSTVRCHYCPQQMSGVRLPRHVRLCHPAAADRDLRLLTLYSTDSTGRRLYTCPNCTTSFQQSHFFLAHVRSFHQNLRFACHSCGMGFHEERLLTQHQLVCQDRVEPTSSREGTASDDQDVLPQQVKTEPVVERGRPESPDLVSTDLEDSDSDEVCILDNYECMKCSKLFYDIQVFRHHLSQHSFSD